MSLFIMLCQVNGFAQEGITKHLAVGTPAPPIQALAWLKGQPIHRFAKDSLYIVEFSGTWCPPCRKAIPHFTALAKEYADQAVFVSVYLENNDPTKRNDTAYIRNVRDLMREMGDRMDFPVAVDLPSQSTRTAWKASSLPLVYIVDGSGRIGWVGKPDGIEEALLYFIGGDDAVKVNAILAEKNGQFAAAYDTIRAHQEAGAFRDAILLLDSLIARSPTGKLTSLYLKKFFLLAEFDAEKAYDWLLFLVADNVGGFGWHNVITSGFQTIKSDDRNYWAELLVIDHAIRESETPYHKAYPLSIKARTYGAMGKLELAIQAMEGALFYSGMGVDNSVQIDDYRSRLDNYMLMNNVD